MTREPCLYHPLGRASVKAEIVTMPMLAEQVEEIIAAHPFGRASAPKRGRNSKFPWVPVIDYGKQAIGVHATRTYQLRAFAYEAREAAVCAAQRAIDANREMMRSQMLNPRYRALREQYGLPREIV